jgi:hypothetical protein
MILIDILNLHGMALKFNPVVMGRMLITLKHPLFEIGMCSFKPKILLYSNAHEKSEELYMRYTA